MIENDIILKIDNKLSKDYNIKSDKIEKNIDSTDGNVYIIYSGEKKYVLKLYDNLKHVQSMISLHTFLKIKNINIPSIIPTINKQLYNIIDLNEYVVIYSFMDGEQLKWDKTQGNIDSEIIKSIARELKKFHLITQNNNEFNLPELSFGRKTERNSVLHFDLTKHNIFINKDNNKIGLIDFDDAKFGASVCDLAIIVSILFFSKTNGANLKGAQHFIDEYYGENFELKKLEKPLIKEFALGWINYILSGNEFDTSTTESFEIRKQLINEYL